MQIDHIIIGSGMAGLTNACLWANEGQKVLVLEHANFPQVIEKVINSLPE
jgi:phytoene dehydrogenase-like protein